MDDKSIQVVYKTLDSQYIVTSQVAQDDRGIFRFGFNVYKRVMGGWVKCNPLKEYFHSLVDARNWLEAKLKIKDELKRQIHKETNEVLCDFGEGTSGNMNQGGVVA